LWDVREPSFWRDEAATLSAARRTPGALWEMLQNIDLVHGIYYFLLWPFVHAFGDSEAVARIPSVAAMAVAALGVTLLGARLVSHRAGVLCGLVFAIAPTVSRYGQEARSTALVMALATLATLVLLVAFERGGRRWYAAYAGLLAVTIAAGLMSVLLVPVHAFFAWRLRGPGRASPLRSWCRSAAVAVLVSAPIAAGALRQRDAVQWIEETDGDRIVNVLLPLFGSGLVFVIAPLVLTGAAWAVGLGRSGAEHDRSREAFRLLAVWAFLPAALLLVLSLVQPTFLFRYLAGSFPAVALMAGCVLDALGARARLVAVAAAALLLVPAHQAVRTTDAHGGEDLRALSAYLDARDRPGDAVVYLPAFWRHVAAAYPEGFAGVRDLAERESPADAGNLSGLEVGAPEFGRRLRTVPRVWIVEPAEPDLTGARDDPLWAAKTGIGTSPDFTLAAERKAGGYRLRLFTRTA
jgi:mannosyltransferase